MDKSKELYDELCQLYQKEKVISDEEEGTAKKMAGLVLEAVAMERLFNPNDLRLVGLHAIIDATRKELAGRWKLYRSSVNKAEGRLRALTGPVIQRHVEEITKIQTGAKVEREIVKQDYHGFEKKWKLTVMTNQNAISSIHQLCKKAIAHLEGLNLRPIPVIDEKYHQLRTEIDQIDPLRFEELVMDQEDYYRGGPPPQGPGTNYSGPLTSMPMGPAKPLSVKEGPLPSGWFKKEN
jgi:hypothetical protein